MFAVLVTAAVLAGWIEYVRLIRTIGITVNPMIGGGMCLFLAFCFYRNDYYLVWLAVNLISLFITWYASRSTLEDIDFPVMESCLYTQDLPELDLLIRTSGEKRISNFLLYQMAYTELHYTQVLWPQFTEDDLLKAIIDFQGRERRFGMIGDQIVKA